jgi:predicted nucleic acid-binding protein
VSGCVLDTGVVIGALDRRDPHHSSAATAIKRLADDGVSLFLSLINYAETLVRPAEDEHTLKTARDALAALGSSWSLLRPLPRWTRRGIAD